MMDGKGVNSVFYSLKSKSVKRSEGGIAGSKRRGIRSPSDERAKERASKRADERTAGGRQASRRERRDGEDSPPVEVRGCLRPLRLRRSCVRRSAQTRDEPCWPRTRHLGWTDGEGRMRRGSDAKTDEPRTDVSDGSERERGCGRAATTGRPGRGRCGAGHGWEETRELTTAADASTCAPPGAGASNSWGRARHVRIHVQALTYARAAGRLGPPSPNPAGGAPR